MAGRENDTEAMILGDIADNTGDTFDDTPSDATADDGSSHSAEPDAPSTEARDNVKPKQGKEQSNKVANPKLAPPKKGEEQKKLPKRDDKGNLVDDQGNIIAAKGAERRIHQQNERLRESNTNLTNQIGTLQRQLQEQSALNGLPKQYGLDASDVNEAFRIAGAFKKSPTEGARMAVTHALSQGVPLNEIISEELIPNVTLEAQKKMMEDMHRKQYGPIEQERKQREVVERAREQSNQFAIQYPDAEEHHDDIARMIPEVVSQAQQQGRQIDAYTAAEIALSKLQRFAMENGLDPKRAIGPQIEEIKARNNVPQGGQRPPIVNPNARQPLPRRQAPMPNGSRGVDHVPSNSGSLPASASNDVIVREAMRASGIKF